MEKGDLEEDEKSISNICNVALYFWSKYNATLQMLHTCVTRQMLHTKNKNCGWLNV